MNRLLTYILLFSLILQVSSSLVVKLNYAINIDYIAEVLCINKDKPELSCHGKCHLAKELKKDDQRKTDKTTNQEERLYLLTSTPDISYKWNSFRLDKSNSKIYQFAIIEADKTVSEHPPALFV